VVTIKPAPNGVLVGNAQYKLDVVNGNYAFVDPVSGNTVTSLTTSSDHAGTITAIIRVPSGITSQVGLLRVTHVSSGVSSVFGFTITGANNATLTATPTDFTFTGADTQHCGTGNGTFLVFGGAPPYTATLSDNHLSISNTTSATQPGKFTVIAADPNYCLNPGNVIITDSLGAHVNVTVHTATGSATPPPGPISISPSTLTLSCGASGSVTVVGGSGTYSASSANGDLTPVVAGNTLTITRAANDGATGPFPASQTVTVTDGATTSTVTVNTATTCP
jgi:hypothetical protein